MLASTKLKWDAIQAVGAPSDTTPAGVLQGFFFRKEQIIQSSPTSILKDVGFFVRCD